MKRFIDTTLWDKPWYRAIGPAGRDAWHFITSKCDNVGVWVPDFGAAEFYIGGPVDWDSLIEKSNGNIKVLENGKWWLVDFVDFQYGKLRDTCTPHRSYIELLKKHGLLKGYSKGIYTLQDKDKDIDKDKGKDKEKEREELEITAVIEFFNKHTDSHVRPGTEALRSKIRARLSEGYSLDDCKRAIAYCHGSWKDNDFKQYIRIPTIFGAEKFAGYVDAHYHETEAEA